MKKTHTISLGDLRRLIKEVADESTGLIELPHDELVAAISAMAGDEEARADYVDADSGEIMLQKGESASTCYLHPEYVPRSPKPRDTYNDLDVPDDEDEEGYDYSKSDNEYMRAINDYADNWSGWASDEIADEDPSSQAYDAADGFFAAYPNWKRWSNDLGISKEEMKSAVAEFVYDAMIGG